MRLVRTAGLTDSETQRAYVPAASGRQIFVGYGLAALVVAADRLTKAWAQSGYAATPLEVIPGWLTFRFTENPGAAFSLFQNAGPFLGIAAVVAVGFVSAALARPRPRHETIAFGLIIGGALGNLIDRIFRGVGFLDGHVVDWVQLPNFPTFNLADSAISVAVATLLLGSWRSRPPSD